MRSGNGSGRSQPNPPTEGFDLPRILQALNSHQVVFLVVGGANTVVQGADYVTQDVDVLPRADRDNVRRLGAAMEDLGARLRVGGMTDEEAKTLPVQIG